MNYCWPLNQLLLIISSGSEPIFLVRAIGFYFLNLYYRIQITLLFFRKGKKKDILGEK